MKLSKVGGEDKGVGLRPKPKDNSNQALIQKLDSIEKALKSIAINTNKTSDIMQRLHSDTSEYYDNEKNKKKG
jgi:hypothetical protein